MFIIIRVVHYFFLHVLADNHGTQNNNKSSNAKIYQYFGVGSTNLEGCSLSMRQTFIPRVTLT